MTRAGWVSGWLAVACSSPVSDGASTDSGSDTAAAPRAPAQWFDWNLQRFGTSIAASPGWIAIGGPSDLFGLDETLDSHVRVLLPPFDGSLPTNQHFLGDPRTEEEEWGHGMGTSLAAVGDVTGDGVADLAAFGDARCFEPERTAWIFPGPFVSGETRNNTDPDVLQLGAALHGVRCADQSGDGVDDLCLNTGVYAVPVLPGASPLVAWGGFTLLASADLDGDGVDELFAWDEGSAALRSFVAGVVTATWRVTPGQGVQGLEADGDLNGDGREDLVVLSGGTAFVLTSPAGGDLVDAPLQVGPGAQGIAVGDLDRDGRADLALGGLRGTDPGDVRVALFRGPLAPGRHPADTADAELRPLPGPSDCCQTFGAALRIADTDGDGGADLLVGDPDHQRYSYVDPGGAVTLFFDPFVLR